MRIKPRPMVAGFYYGVPWRAATRINVFCRIEVCLARPVMTCIIRIVCNYFMARRE